MDGKRLIVGDQVFHLLEGPTADGFLGDDTEPDLHLVEARRVVRCVEYLVLRLDCDPAFHFFAFVGGIVFDDEVNVKVLRDVLVDIFEELKKTLVSMSRSGLGEHLA